MRRRDRDREAEFAATYELHGTHLLDDPRKWDEDTALAYQQWLYVHGAISLPAMEWRVESIMQRRAEQVPSWQSRALSYRDAMG